MNEKFLVIANKGFKNEEIYYCGDSEIAAFKRFREINFNIKEIVRANVKMVKMMGFELIETYEIIEKIA